MVLAPFGLLIFCLQMIFWCSDANGIPLDYLGQVLIWFQVVSGIKINLGKCEIISVGEVGNIDMLALPSTQLGLLLGSSNKGLNIWNTVIQRVEKRLAGCKKGTCSKEGRKCLLRVLSRVSLHIVCHCLMRLLVLLESWRDCKEIFCGMRQMGQKNFIWSDVIP